MISGGGAHLGRPVDESGDGVKGKSTSHLFKGEAVAAGTSLVIGRKTKSSIRVQVVGHKSIGWLEAAKLWGANIEARVVRHCKPKTPLHFPYIRE